MNQEWMQQGICRGMTELFFPKLKERPERQKRREHQAASICQQCPVITQCREYGRKNHEYGVWGGEGENDRHLAGYTLSALTVKMKRLKQKTEKTQQNNTTTQTPTTTKTLTSL